MKKTRDKTGVIDYISFILLGYSFLSLTAGQYLPGYFINADNKALYYFSVLSILVISIMIITFRFSFKRENCNTVSSALIALFFGILSLIFFGIWTIAVLFSGRG